MTVNLKYVCTLGLSCTKNDDPDMHSKQYLPIYMYLIPVTNTIAISTVGRRGTVIIHHRKKTQPIIPNNTYCCLVHWVQVTGATDELPCHW